MRRVQPDLERRADPVGPASLVSRGYADWCAEVARWSSPSDPCEAIGDTHSASGPVWLSRPDWLSGLAGAAADGGASRHESSVGESQPNAVLPYLRALEAHGVIVEARRLTRCTRRARLCCAAAQLWSLVTIYAVVASNATRSSSENTRRPLGSNRRPFPSSARIGPCGAWLLFSASVSREGPSA
jgi:hypothetical protein